MNVPKPLLDVLPSIDSPYTLIAFSLIVLIIVIKLILKQEGPVMRIIEKKLTKAQAFSMLKLLTILLIIFAILIYMLGYISELGKLFKNKSKQTSIVLYDRVFDVSNDFITKNEPPKGYFVSTDPHFSFPAPDPISWEKPLWVDSKEDLLKYFSLTFPKDIDLEDPFFDFLANGRFLLILSKQQFNLHIDKQSSIFYQYPFEEEEVIDYIFEEPFIIKGRHHLAIITIPKASLSSRFINVNLATLVSYYLGNSAIRPEQLIATKNSAVLIAHGEFKNALFQSKRQNIKIQKYLKFIDSNTHFYLLEGNCYDPDQVPKISDYIVNAVFKFTVPQK